VPSPLRLLFLTQCPPSLELGGSKSQLELAAELEPLGWHCRVAGPDASGIAAPAELLREPWDVVDWDIHLAVPRSALPAGTLSLARIPFLNLHLRGGQLPWPLGHWRWRRRAQHLLRQRRGGRSEIQELADAQVRVRQALAQADVLNTWNSADTRLLIEQEGVAANRLIERPPGLTHQRLQALAALPRPRPQAPGSGPVIVVLASFDFRKGCLDLPRILGRLRRQHPHIQLRLLGTNGLFRSEASVRRFFSADQQAALEVVPHFIAADLPRWLADADAGLFPSYLEGFGIAVIEQLAAGLPVFAYDVPGPCDSLPPDWRVPAGHWQALADRLSATLCQPAEIQGRIATEARQRAWSYSWTPLAQEWDHIYRLHLESLHRMQ
jgi:glycosyltransferase involved in cell wall biosynthesis